MRKVILLGAMVLLSFSWAPVMAQVGPGCQAVSGKGYLCKSRVTFSGGLTLPQSTVAQLPTCNAALKGTLRAVSDATAPTYNGALTGGGAVSVPVYCSGAAWLSH